MLLLRAWKTKTASRLVGVAIALLVSSRAAPSAAEPEAGEIRFRADTTTLDLHQQGADEATLAGHVVVTYDRFRLTSDKLTVRRKPSGVELSGETRLAFCLCDDPPVSIGSSGATLSKDGEFQARFPRFYLGSVPVFALPWIWIRPADRVGLLPPFVLLRGESGLLVGAGARLPWRNASGDVNAIELRAAGYVRSGFELDTRFQTKTATGKFVWDHLRDDRFVLETRGFVPPSASRGVSLAWDADALRGPRGLVATPSFSAAAKPFDVGVVETSALLWDTGTTRGAASAAVVGRAERALGDIVWGPRASIETSTALFGRGHFEADAFFGVLTRNTETTPLGRADAALVYHPKAGSLRLETSLRTRARIAAPAHEKTSSWDLAADARATATLPFVKVFPFARAAAPLVHHVSPVVEARLFFQRGGGSFFETATSSDPALGLGVLGLSSVLGRGLGGSIDTDLRVAFAGTRSGSALLGYARVAGSSGVLAMRLDLSAAQTVAGQTLPGGTGLGAVFDTRVGDADGFFMRLAGAVRTSEAGTLARSLGPSGPFPLDVVPLVATRGLSLGGDGQAPLGRAFFLQAGASVDVFARALLGGRASLRYRHPEGCAAFELGGSYRVGRPGVDLWLLVDLVPAFASSRSR